MVDATNTVLNLAETAIAGIRWQGGTKKYCTIITRYEESFQPSAWIYADDITISVLGKHLADVVWVCETSARLIKDRRVKVDGTQDWGCFGQLSQVQGIAKVVQSKALNKYLEVMQDHRLTFKEHLSYADEKVGKIIAALTAWCPILEELTTTGMMPNTGGANHREGTCYTECGHLFCCLQHQFDEKP